MTENVDGSDHFVLVVTNWKDINERKKTITVGCSQTLSLRLLAPQPAVFGADVLVAMFLRFHMR